MNLVGVWLRPVFWGLLQVKQVPQQLPFLQLLHPHQLQNQESRHHPQDVCVGLRAWNTNISPLVRYIRTQS